MKRRYFLRLLAATPVLHDAARGRGESMNTEKVCRNCRFAVKDSGGLRCYRPDPLTGEPIKRSCAAERRPWLRRCAKRGRYYQNNPGAAEENMRRSFAAMATLGANSYSERGLLRKAQEALGLLSTLAPNVVVDANDPVRMAHDIIAHIDALKAENHALAGHTNELPTLVEDQSYTVKGTVYVPRRYAVAWHWRMVRAEGRLRDKEKA